MLTRALDAEQEQKNPDTFDPTVNIRGTPSISSSRSPERPSDRWSPSTLARSRRSSAASQSDLIDRIALTGDRASIITEA